MLYLNRGDGICQKGCSNDFQCKTYGEKCIDGQCQSGCTYSSQCKTYGEKCIDGQCQPGCTDNGQCKNGNLLRGYCQLYGCGSIFCLSLLDGPGQ